MKSSHLVTAGCILGLSWLAACPSDTPCQTDTDCGAKQVCVNQVCVNSYGPTVDAAGLVDAQVDARVLDSSAPVDAGAVDSAPRPDAAQPDLAPPDSQVAVDSAPRPDSAQTPDTATAPDTSVATDAASAPDTAVAPDAVGADVDCTPSCGSRVCGDNGCGGSCGPCSGATPACLDGTCVACAVDGDCAVGKCEKATGTCLQRACIYDEHCAVAYYGHCSSTYACVSAHDCVDELAYIPYPWDDSMTVVITGDTADADSVYTPSAGCDDAAGPEDIYELILPRQVRKVTLTLQALPDADSWDSVLYVAANVCGSTNLGCADDLMSAQPEVLVVDDPVYSTVTVVVDGYEYNDAGAYRLSMTVDECDGEGDCTQNERCLSPAANNSRCIRE